jgi:hypothetical protein
MAEQINIEMGKPTGPERPEPEESGKILGKFNSVEDLQNAYVELERRQSRPSDPAPPPPVEAEEVDAEAPLAPKAKSLKPDLDLDIPPQPGTETKPSPEKFLEEFSNEFLEKGKLSGESYSKLEKAGYPRIFVDRFINGVRAEAAQQEAAVFQITGGKDKFQQMKRWAYDNVPRDELLSINAAIQGPDVNLAIAAIRGLHAQFERSGAAGTTVDAEGFSARSDVGQPFRSEAEVTAAMRDPRYRDDPAYRESVAQRLANFQGFTHTKAR